jgi:hypothetical protein
MRRQFLPRLLIHSWTSRTQLAPYKPGNYALCRGCALSTTLTLGIVLAALQLRLRRRERVPGPSGTAWLRSQVVGTKAPVDEVSFLLHSNQSEAHIRVKRYRQSMNQGSRSNGCRFGTCTFQKLAHQIYQLTDKDKDGMAPRNKISPQGYGRRRRRSLLEVLRSRTVESSQEQTHTAPGPWAHISRLFRI